MKYLLFSTIFIYSLYLNAESLPEDHYEIISSEFDSKIPKGKCKLTGKVLSLFQTPVHNGIISNLTRSSHTTTDKEGNYSLFVDTKDTAFFFYHPEFGEIVIWSIHLKDQHNYKIDFHTSPKDDFPVEAEKPVIYLYGNEGSEVNVKFTFNGDVKFTYPPYENGWNLMLGNNGSITDQNTGRSFPYLFWEGQSESINYSISNGKMEGFLIKTDTCISFLENSLTTLGLNSREQSDFITYWTPRMTQCPYLMLQFLVDDDYISQIGELNIDPKPESLRRVYLLYTPLFSEDVNFEIITQHLRPFERKGFTIVEWGGSELKYLYSN